MDSLQSQHASGIETVKAWLGSGSINLFGAQYSGKDTQSKRLAKLLNGHALSGGDILRASQNQEVMGQINTGNLAPIDAYLQIVLPHLARKEFSGKPLILSAVGRWHGEESGVIEAAKTAGHPLKAVIYLKMDESEAWKRRAAAINRQERGDRQDEDESALKRRLEEFRDKTLPAIEFYRDKGLLIELDGSQSLDDVTSAIISNLANFAR